MSIISTKGIVLKSIKYSESDIIVHIYTQHLGTQSFLIKGIRKAKSKQRITLFQPLSLLELEFNHKEKNSLQFITESKLSYTYKTAQSDMKKCCILFFLSEILSKVLHEYPTDDDLFEFIYNSLTIFDLTEEKIVDFHLIFLTHLSKHLGFIPTKNEGSYNVFDLQSGIFTNTIPDHNQYIQTPLSEELSKIVNSRISDYNFSLVTPKHRHVLLSRMMDFYSIHSPNFLPIHSQNILHEILR